MVAWALCSNNSSQTFSFVVLWCHGFPFCFVHISWHFIPNNIVKPVPGTPECIVNTRTFSLYYAFCFKVFYFILHEKGLGRAQMLCYIALSRVMPFDPGIHILSFGAYIFSNELMRYTYIQCTPLAHTHFVSVFQSEFVQHCTIW